MMLKMIHHFATLLFVLPFSSFPTALRVRRSGLVGYDDPYALANALAEVDREDIRPLGFGNILDDDSYFDPVSDIEYAPNYIYPKAYPTYERRDSYINPYGGLSRKRMHGPTKRTSYNPHRVVPTMEELERVFGSADVPMKRGVPMKRRNSAASKQSTAVSKAKRQHSEVAGLENMRKLLKAAEEITEQEVETLQENGGKPEVVKEVVVEKIVSPDDDTQAKLKEIFSEAGDEANDTEDAAEENDDGEEPIDSIAEEDDANTAGEEEEIEIPSTNIVEHESDHLEQAQAKSKRDSNGYNDAGYVNELKREIDSLRNKVSRLELKEVLEDQENDDLANALKYATLDQIDNSDAYVGKEYDHINRATETEELIDLLAEEMEDGDDDEFPEIRERLSEYLDATADNAALEKRSEEPIVPPNVAVSDDGDRWYDAPVREDVGFGAQLEDPEDDDVDDDVMEEEDDELPPLDEGPDVPIDLPYPDEDLDVEEADDVDDDVDDEEEEEEAEQEALEDAAEEVAAEIADEKAQVKEQALLRQLLRGMSPEELTDLMHQAEEQQEEDEEVEEEDTLDHMCPAVIEMSNNCAFADAYGIPIDEEARSLCSRHQMCYTCGSALGISREGCDEGYTQTIMVDCEEDRKCERNAILFLGVMGKYHNYNIQSPRECQDTCVQDFIYGNEGGK